jgi:hypothetical protein
LLDEEIIEEKKSEEIKQNVFDDRIFYDNTQMKYFDIESFLFKQPADLARHYNVKPKDFEDMRIKKVIPNYDGVCYLD